MASAIPPVKLLIVDDSTVIRSRIARLAADPRLPPLEVVASATNGAEAIDAFQRHGPNLVTMDLTMPTMDGVECTEALIALSPDLRILVVSAISDKSTAISALTKGAQGFLYKPFTDDQMVAAFLEILS